MTGMDRQIGRDPHCTALTYNNELLGDAIISRTHVSAEQTLCLPAARSY